MWREQGHQADFMSKQTVISMCYFIVCQGSAVQSQQAYKAYMSWQLKHLFEAENVLFIDQCIRLFSSLIYWYSYTL